MEVLIIGVLAITLALFTYTSGYNLGYKQGHNYGIKKGWVQGHDEVNKVIKEYVEYHNGDDRNS